MLSPGCVPGLSICSRAHNPLLISAGGGDGDVGKWWGRELFAQALSEGRDLAVGGWVGAGQGARLGVPRWSEYGGGLNSWHCGVTC